jgi:hypothetical protein
MTEDEYRDQVIGLAKGVLWGFGIAGAIIMLLAFLSVMWGWPFK